MPSLCSSRNVGGLLATLVAAFALALPATGFAKAEKVTTYKDELGWKLKVAGRDYYVKGVVWGYSPRNQNYTYNLWGESDEFIRKVLDYDFGLMSKGGVNAVRSFGMIPPEWVTYIYREHGIMTVVNPLMGRYGYTVGGKWVPFTDYSDPLTRETLLRDSLAIVEQYKDTEGVLMFAFGNESNYGLSWSSFEIENLPEGERNTAKAVYLYTLFNEVMKAGKKIAPNHPFSIVNGDIQYIDLIVEHCPDLDVLGSNVYRGPSFTSLWRDVDEKLDLPVLFFEFGSDAFNAREYKEDQASQAKVLKSQWQEMYNQAYGNGAQGNSIGGFVFEWRDEWWKYLQVENLDVHDNNASWSNQAYLFDWAEGKNNMNEEWFGIAALGKPNADGVYQARPRMAYDVLSAIWAMDPYSMQKNAFNQAIDNLDMERYELQGDVRQLKMARDEQDSIVRFTGGSALAVMAVQGTQASLDENGLENGLAWTDGQMLFLDFGFSPNDKLDGQFSLNILANVPNLEPLEIVYGRRGLPITVQGLVPPIGSLPGTPPSAETEVVLNDRERVEIYDFSATYEGENFDYEAFYNTPRYHWKYEGDFFGLIREATDIAGTDIWNAKPPYGVELAGKGGLDGLKIVAGPEIWWGANPKVVLKYSNSIGSWDYTVMHSDDIARRANGVAAAQATIRQTRETTLYLEKQLTDSLKLELGGMVANTNRDGEAFKYVDGPAIKEDTIEFEDSLAFRSRLSFPLFGSLAYVATNHAGLVAEGGDVLREFGTRLPYSGLGNTQEYEAGAMINFGNLMVFPRVLYRENLIDAAPFREPSISPGGVLNPGIAPRNRDDDPFAVLGNREARAAELFITWDPTGATPFYQWDNDWREDAKFAWNLGLNYTELPTFADAELFFFDQGTGQGFNASFGVGLPPEDTWEVSSRSVWNPTRFTRIITNLRGGFLQSIGDPTGGTREFYEVRGKIVRNQKYIFEYTAAKDAFGPYDFHRQFNITYPWQYRADLSMLLDERRDELNSTTVGIRGELRRLDENSPEGESLDLTNDYIFQTVFYFRYAF